MMLGKCLTGDNPKFQSPTTVNTERSSKIFLRLQIDLRCNLVAFEAAKAMIYNCALLRQGRIFDFNRPKLLRLL